MVQILAVVRFYQDREKQANTQEDEVWEKMGHAGPQHPSDMSRENSREGGAKPDYFAHPVSTVLGLLEGRLRVSELHRCLLSRRPLKKGTSTSGQTELHLLHLVLHPKHPSSFPQADLPFHPSWIDPPRTALPHNRPSRSPSTGPTRPERPRQRRLHRRVCPWPSRPQARGPPSTYTRVPWLPSHWRGRLRPRRMRRSRVSRVDVIRQRRMRMLCASCRVSVRRETRTWFIGACRRSVKGEFARLQ